MKIEFEDKSYLEIINSINPGKILITVVAKNAQDHSSLIVNSVEITKDQLNSLIDGLEKT